MIVKKKCPECGSEFIDKRGRKVYCSLSCYRANNIRITVARRREKLMSEHKDRSKVCLGCGKSFVPTASRQYYCSKECRKKTGRGTDFRLRRSDDGKTCKVCGETLTNTRCYGDYCSKECREEDYFRKRCKDKRLMYRYNDAERGITELYRQYKAGEIDALSYFSQRNACIITKKSIISRFMMQVRDD